MTTNMEDGSNVEQQRSAFKKGVVEIARSMLGGELSWTVGCQQLVLKRDIRATPDDYDDVAEEFIAWADQMHDDRFPGPGRGWPLSEVELVEKWESYLEREKGAELRAACKIVINRYSE